MVVLGRNTPRLLKRVGGKQHASENDHEETFGRQRGQDASTLTDEDQLNREPVSSGDEARPPPMPSPAPLPKATRLPKATNSAQKGNTESNSPALRLPQPKSAKKTTALHIPRTGSFQRGKEDKEKRGLEGGDEISALSAPSAPSSPNGNNSGDAWGFGLSSQPSSQSQKKQFGAKRNGTSNIHAPSLNPKSGPKKPVKYGARSRPVYNSNAEATFGSDEEVDMLHNNELDTALGEDEDKSTSDIQLRRPMAKRKRNNDSDVSQSKLDDEELDALLGSSNLRRPPAKKRRTNNDDPDSDLQLPQLREPTKKKKRTDDDQVASEAALFDDEEELETILRPDKPALLHQLGEWFQDRTPDSSQPQSSAPQEDVDNLDNLEGYIHKLPEEAPEGTICTICHEPVASSDYWAFWTHKLKTVKNQTAFCTLHRRQTAQEEYTREGYPTIDWPTLPHRIKQHRMALHKVLTNEHPSTYRDRYAPLALTGKAAAVPSRHTAAAASSYTLDDHATYPGYYGARGRRAITEAVMALLRNEIKRSRDPVVQTSGPAAFVQAVLVPEVAVRFIMEDCAVDRDEADAIREATYEMGLLLNEEIEDEIEVGEESGGEGGEIGVL